MMWGVDGKYETVEPSSSSDDSTAGGLAGLYKWTRDALFGTRISPSRKYKEFAQDDTNYRLFHTSASRTERRSRSNSWSGADSAGMGTFHKRYELLPDTPSDRESLLEPIDIRPKENTDTFAVKNGKRSDDILEEIEPQDAAHISKLFGSNTSYQLPGKFPTPRRSYDSEYLKLLQQLDHNSKMLTDMNHNIKQRRATQEREENINRAKYLEIKQVLNKEIKYSKRLYDAYYNLLGKYNDLKALCRGITQMQTQISKLKVQLEESALERETRISTLSTRVADLENQLEMSQLDKETEKYKYEIKIAELEERLREQSSLPHTDSGHSYGDRIPFTWNYETSLDTGYMNPPKNA